MKLKLLKRKSWSDENGVSEIIGNIMILMITVVLFSGIMMFVNQMPVPELTTKADFSANVAFEDLGSTATLTVTHVGGATMDAAETLILVSIDEMTYGYRLSEDANFSYEEWAMGLAWTKEFSGTSYASSISITIVDDISHNAIWISQVSGGMGGTPPTILQRYVDSNPDTISADPVKEYDDFTLFVKISDLDKDLKYVWVDSSSIVGGSSNDSFETPSGGTVPVEGGWFEWNYNDVANDSALIDGKTLVIHAQDAAGHRTTVAYELSVIVLPTDIDYYPADTTPQEGGMPSYIKNINEGQGFGVFGENLTSHTANISDARTVFARGEKVFVRVASLYLTNIFGGNDLTFTDSRSNIDFTYLVTFVPLSTPTDPFYSYAYGGNVAVYQSVFNTSGMLPGAYTMHMVLKATGATHYVFDSSQTLYVTDTESPMSYYPVAWTFKDAGYTTEWGNEKTTPFNVSATNYKMYVAIYVQDAVSSPSPSVGEVRIVDMTGGTQLYGPPGSGSMISSVSKSATNSTAYVFTIDLRLNNGDKWKTGTNSYTLEIAQFSDNNEGVYSYSRQIFIKASSSRADFFIATNGAYSTKGGSTNFISPEYAYYTENNNFFTSRVLYCEENSPSAAPVFYLNAIALGDLDNDGDQDLLVGSNNERGSSFDEFGQLLYFENTMNTWGNWQSPSVITRPTGDPTTDRIEWLDMGDINADGDTDFAYCTSGHKVVIYNNTYGAGGTVFATYTASNDGVRKIALEDMTGDGRADLIVLANGKVYMYDLTKWTSGLFATLPNPAITSSSNIEDFDIADMNNDGMLDIITVDPNPSSHDLIEGVWVNNYTVNPTPTRSLVKNGTAVLQPAGTVVSGTMQDTQTLNVATPSPMVLRENISGEDDEGALSFIFTMQNPLSSYTDQQLIVRAKLSSDAQEVAYVWYSTDTNPLGTMYTPVIVVTGTDYANYTFNLPPSLAGAAQLYIKVTDSSTQLGLANEYLYIDYIAVQSNRFGSYWPNPMISPANRYQVTGVNSTYQTYTTARAINWDGLKDDNRLEVVVAKNGKWVLYDHRTANTAWMIQNQTNFYIYSGGLSTSVAISPTLFEVVDINGDGLDDILTVWSTVGSTSEQSLLKVYLNIDPTMLWPVNVKDLFQGMLPGTETGCIVSIAAGDIFNRT